MMALRHGLQNAKASLLSYFRQVPENSLAPFGALFARSLAEGTFLDRNNVTERVLHVVRHFEKIDPAKVHRLPLQCNLTAALYTGDARGVLPGLGPG